MKKASQGKQASPHRLNHFTPLRYPGGKGKLASFVKEIVKANGLMDGEYAEPYAGGAAIALELLLQEYVSKIHINDISKPIYSFWKSVLDDTDRFTKLVRDTPLTVQAWDKQKKILSHPEDHDALKLGFAAFFLNRTNRSGILNAGIIGGRDQTGPWKIDARYNAEELCKRIDAIANLRDRIKLSREDAQKFLIKRVSQLPEKTLIYLDPPYYIKGKELYLHYYDHIDHVEVAKVVTSKIKKQRWIVSYDNVDAIHEMYDGARNVVYGIGYSAREARDGAEVMFFSDKMVIPPLTGAMFPLGKRKAA